MSAIAHKALPFWGLQGGCISLVAARENAVYRVDHQGQSYALRLHRIGYRSDAELRSELQWMAIFAGTEISVPTPVAAQDGTFLRHIDGVQIDVLEWLSGAPLRSVETELSRPERADVFRRLGRDMARMHRQSDAWERPDGFTRRAWDHDGLLGEAPLWGRFWDNPALSHAQAALLSQMRRRALDDLAHLQGGLDFGLIHADLVSANVMVDGAALHLIDFDDGGFGFRVFDVATSLLKFMGDADYADLGDALIEGYRAERPLDLDALDLFLALRAATYVGWNITRMDEADGEVRNARFINTACQLAQRYLAT